MKTLSGLLICVVLMCNTSYTYYYYMGVWKKILDKKTLKVHTIIGIADFHDKDHPITSTQRAHFDYVLQKLKEKKGKLIVEDFSSAGNNGIKDCSGFGVYSDQGGLGRLADKARLMGVIVDNVEYRYCRVAAIGPLLKNLDHDPYSFKAALAITTLLLHQEVVNAFDKIKKYNDGKFLNRSYKKAIELVSKALVQFNLDQKKPLNMAEYCSRLLGKDYKEKLEKLCMFDSSLLDMNIMHSIVSSSSIPYIIVAAGGAHIEQMSLMLKKLGYELVFETPGNNKSVSGKKNNILLPEQAQGPEFVDITMLDKFLS